MRQLSPAGKQAINDLAQRHGFSSDAVLSMLQSVINGHGSMAQFSHPEFGGSGQWMRSGMIMVPDMFNNLLKGRIDALCRELSGLVANETGLITSGSFQSQSQGSQQQGGSGPAGPVSLFVPPTGGGSGNWWPENLGWASSTGMQNGIRYAYFAQARRLAIEIGGTVTVYDTLDHQIGSFSQQQSHGGSLTFSTNTVWWMWLPFRSCRPRAEQGPRPRRRDPVPLQLSLPPTSSPRSKSLPNSTAREF
jgi:hypothetical protein